MLCVVRPCRDARREIHLSMYATTSLEVHHKNILEQLSNCCHFSNLVPVSLVISCSHMLYVPLVQYSPCVSVYDYGLVARRP